MPSNNPGNIGDLLGLHPHSVELSKYIASLAAAAAAASPIPDATIPDIKSYPDVVYLNYFALGLSLVFVPLPGYTPTTGIKHSQLNDNQLILDSINLYNIPNPPNAKQTSSRPLKLAFSTYPCLPLVLAIAPEIKDPNDKPLSRPSDLEIRQVSTGKDFVNCLGEPNRKGGGAGPSSGSIGIWCEWSQDGLMVEFGGDEAKGPQAWERGKDAVWKVVTLFSATK